MIPRRLSDCKSYGQFGGNIWSENLKCEIFEDPKDRIQNSTITANNDHPPDPGLKALTGRFVVAFVAIPRGRHHYTDPFHRWGTWGLRRNSVNSPVNTAHQQWTGAQIQIWIQSLPLGSMLFWHRDHSPYLPQTQVKLWIWEDRGDVHVVVLNFTCLKTGLMLMKHQELLNRHELACQGFRAESWVFC